MPDKVITPIGTGGAQKNSMSRLVVLLVAILAIAAVVSFAWSLIPERYKTWQSSSHLWDTYAAMRDGNLQSALAASQSIQADPNVSADEKARAILLTLGAGSRLSGDASAILADVQNLKESIINDEVSVPVRARLVSALAAQYALSGNDAAVFAEMFKTEPFSTYLVPRDIDQSIHNLYEWSYTISPTALATINLARWYSEPVLPRTSQLTWTMTDESAKRAEGYLLEADALVAEEMAGDTEFINGSQYFWFRYWRANVVARLADKLGGSYREEYRAGFDELIAFMLAHPAVLAKENLPFARFQYAIWLLQIEDDKVAATQQLDMLAQELSKMPYLDSNPFVLSVRDAYANSQEGGLWNFIGVLAKLSPKFEAQIRSLFGI